MPGTSLEHFAKLRVVQDTVILLSVDSDEDEHKKGSMAIMLGQFLTYPEFI